MNAPARQLQGPGRALEGDAERPDVLRMIMEWIADRFADSPELDTSIAWEDGEEHEDEALPPAA